MELAAGVRGAGQVLLCVPLPRTWPDRQTLDSIVRGHRPLPTQVRGVVLRHPGVEGIPTMRQTPVAPSWRRLSLQYFCKRTYAKHTSSIHPSSDRIAKEVLSTGYEEPDKFLNYTRVIVCSFDEL